MRHQLASKKPTHPFQSTRIPNPRPPFYSIVCVRIRLPGKKEAAEKLEGEEKEKALKAVEKETKSLEDLTVRIKEGPKKKEKKEDEEKEEL